MVEATRACFPTRSDTHRVAHATKSVKTASIASLSGCLPKKSTTNVPEQINGGMRRPLFIIENIVLVETVEGVFGVKTRHQYLID